jgi:hypothetical protein
MRPLCFVLMPFGQKPDASGTIVNFDAIYGCVIKPAIQDAEMEPLRADEERDGGIIHKAMFERLILCEFAVADLTTANANVFYELGIRHAVRPWSTVALFSNLSRLPFDVTFLRAIPYSLAAGGVIDNADEVRHNLTERLRQAREGGKDSPVFALVEGMQEQQIDRERTDVFRDRVQYSLAIKERLAEARRRDAGALRAIEGELGRIADAESGVVVDLFLSYRAVRAWKEMIRLVGEMASPLAATVMVQEQYALALNRDEQGEKAESVLVDLLKRRGASSETYGILGRVYKDRWEKAAKTPGQDRLAAGLIQKAIEAYLRGFEADWRDAYPGVNALTAMELREPPDPRWVQLFPVVTYAVERRIAGGKPGYWDYATRLELAVLARDEQPAFTALDDALANVREKWEPETTARNIRLICEARERRGEDVGWAKQIQDYLARQSMS